MSAGIATSLADTGLILSMSSKTVGDYELEDGPKKRGYTTRGKVEQERTAAPKLIRRVRHWEKRWVKHGKMTVMRWQRREEAATESAATE